MRPPKRLKTAQQQHPTGTTWTLSCPPNYSLRAAVVSYGFFMLAPNRLTPAPSFEEPCAFQRLLQTGEGPAVGVTVMQQSCDAQTLGVTASTPLPDRLKESCNSQIQRMLSLRAQDRDLVERFHAVHNEAQTARFGYMFRSPSLWEDIVKSITLCNCGWGRTIAMNAALCEQVGAGAFPSPSQILSAGASSLQACGLGYRVKTLLRVAEQCTDDHLAKLESLADSSNDQDLYQALLLLAGMGPFTCTNVMQLMSRFDSIPCDSETLRHLKACRGLSSTTPANLKRVAAETYSPWQPFQFLVYWFELCQHYQGVYGQFYALDPAHYHKFSGAQLRKHAKQHVPAAVQGPAQGLA